MRQKLGNVSLQSALAIYPMRIKSGTSVAADLQPPPERGQGAEQNRGFCAPGKQVARVFRSVFSGAGLISPILASPCTWKHRNALKSFMIMSAPCDQARPSAKKHVLDCTCSLSPKPHTDLPSSSRAASQSQLRCCLPGRSPHFAQVNLNSQLSHCAYMF